MNNTSKTSTGDGFSPDTWDQLTTKDRLQYLAGTANAPGFGGIAFASRAPIIDNATLLGTLNFHGFLVLPCDGALGILRALDFPGKQHDLIAAVAAETREIDRNLWIYILRPTPGHHSSPAVIMLYHVILHPA